MQLKEVGKIKFSCLTTDRVKHNIKMRHRQQSYLGNTFSLFIASSCKEDNDANAHCYDYCQQEEDKSHHYGYDTSSLSLTIRCELVCGVPHLETLTTHLQTYQRVFTNERFTNRNRLACKSPANLQKCMSRKSLLVIWWDVSVNNVEDFQLKQKTPSRQKIQYASKSGITESQFYQVLKNKLKMVLVEQVYRVTKIKMKSNNTVHACILTIYA